MLTKHRFIFSSISRTAYCVLLASSMMLTACGSSTADETSVGASEQPVEESKTAEAPAQPADNTQDAVPDTTADAGMDTSVAAGAFRFIKNNIRIEKRIDITFISVTT